MPNKTSNTKNIIHERNHFLDYVMKVWIKKNKFPKKLPELFFFNETNIYQNFNSFIKTGKKIPQTGTRLDELYFSIQLLSKKPFLCLINNSFRNKVPNGITQKEYLNFDEIWKKIKLYTNKRKHENKTPMILFINDRFGLEHVITLLRIDNDVIHFLENNKSKSLLCYENNSAGIDAKKSKLIKGGWSITKEEINRVLYAVFLEDTKQDLMQFMLLFTKYLNDNKIKPKDVKKLLSKINKK